MSRYWFHLDKGDPVHRGNDFGNLSDVGIQRAIEPLGWKRDGTLSTNFEGAFTSRRQSIAKGDAKGTITMSIPALMEVTTSL